MKLLIRPIYAASLVATTGINVAESRDFVVLPAFVFPRLFHRGSSVVFTKATDVGSSDMSCMSDVAALERAVMLAANIAEVKEDEANKAALHLRIVQEAKDGLNEMRKQASTTGKSDKDLEAFIDSTPAHQLAVLLLKEAASATTTKIIETKNDIAAADLMVKAAAVDSSSAMEVASAASDDTRAALDRMLSAEELSGSEEVLERRRDDAVIHASQHLTSDAQKVARAANAVKRRWENRERKAEECLKDLMAKEAQLNADLEELAVLIKDETKELK